MLSSDYTGVSSQDCKNSRLELRNDRQPNTLLRVGSARVLPRSHSSLQRNVTDLYGIVHNGRSWFTCSCYVCAHKFTPPTKQSHRFCFYSIRLNLIFNLTTSNNHSCRRISSMWLPWTASCARLWTPPAVAASPRPRRVHDHHAQSTMIPWSNAPSARTIRRCSHVILFLTISLQLVAKSEKLFG